MANEVNDRFRNGLQSSPKQVDAPLQTSQSGSVSKQHHRMSVPSKPTEKGKHFESREPKARNDYDQFALFHDVGTLQPRSPQGAAFSPHFGHRVFACGRVERLMPDFPGNLPREIRVRRRQESASTHWCDNC